MSNITIDPELKPGEFVIKSLFAEFAVLAEKKIEMVMAEPLVSLWGVGGVESWCQNTGNEMWYVARDAAHSAEITCSRLQAGLVLQASDGKNSLRKGRKDTP